MRIVDVIQWWACTALGACSLLPAPSVPEPKLPERYEVSAQTAGNAERLDRWWLLYRDEQLTELVAQALAKAWDVRLASARIDEARALRDAALTRFGWTGALQAMAERREYRNLGNGEGEAAARASGTLGVSTTASVALEASWEIDLFGRRIANRQAADADFAAARFNAEATRAALAAEVARSLFTARGLALSVEDAKATAVIQQGLFDVVAKRAERGLVATSEAARVETNVFAADALVADFQGQLDAARRALLVLIGNAEQPLATLDIRAEADAPPALPAQIPSDVLMRRPDVREARARIDVAAGNHRLAELALWPTINLAPGIGLTSQRSPVSLTLGYWTIGANLLLPVLDRPRLLAEARAQGARVDQTLIAYERAAQNAFSDAEQAFLRLRSDEVQVDKLAAAVDRAQIAASAARRRYDLGFSDLTQVLDAERAYRQARSALSNARTSALLHSVQAFQALGGGWDAEALAVQMP